MDSKYIDIEHLFLSASSYINTINSDLNKILSDPGFPDQVHLLTKTFQKLTNSGLIALENNFEKYTTIEKKVNKEGLSGRYKEAYIESEKKTAIEQIVSIFHYFKYLSGHIRYLISSSIETAPLGLIFPFQKIISGLFPKSFLFLRRQWKHNYKYGEFVKQIIDQDEEPECFDSIKHAFDFTLSMVSYPSMEDDNYLYNCNIAHEVGHYIDDLARKYGYEKDFIKDYDIKEYQTDGNFDKETIKRIITLHWHEEFIADVYATFMLGPAYLFSFLEYHFSGKEIDQVFTEPLRLNQRAYPSARMRLYYIMNTLSYKDRDYTSLFSRYSSKSFKLTSKRLSGLNNIVKDELLNFEGDDIPKFAWGANKSLIGDVLNYAFKIIKPVIEKKILPDLKDELNPEVEKIVKERLDRNIPINEMHDFDESILNTDTSPSEAKSIPISLFTIMNYGWMKFFEIIENNKNIFEAKEKVHSLQLLIKRSAEASYFHQQWIEYKNRIE